MPLTFSHPAIVLPLNYLPKRYISLTGLIIGSVSPDFEYFFRMKVSSIYSHTWSGLFWFDLPVALMLAFVYHDIVRGSFLARLPLCLQKRVSPYNTFNWNEYFIKYHQVVVLSIITGVTSHLFWDSFTHSNGYFVEAWNMTATVSLFGILAPLYKVIQHLSTLVGAIVIIVAIYKMPKQNIVRTRRIWRYWFIVIGFALLVVALRILLGLNIHQYWNILVTAISGMILGIILASVILRKKINVLIP